MNQRRIVGSGLPTTFAETLRGKVRRCSKCFSEDIRRSHRHPIEHVLSWIGLYPYRCESCGARFFAWGERLSSRATRG